MGSALECGCVQEAGWGRWDCVGQEWVVQGCQPEAWEEPCLLVTIYIDGEGWARRSGDPSLGLSLLDPTPS